MDVEREKERAREREIVCVCLLSTILAERGGARERERAFIMNDTH